MPDRKIGPDTQFGGIKGLKSSPESCVIAEIGKPKSFTADFPRMDADLKAFSLQASFRGHQPGSEDRAVSISMITIRNLSAKIRVDPR
jgi:hypothetical protein